MTQGPSKVRLYELFFEIPNEVRFEGSELQFAGTPGVSINADKA